MATIKDIAREAHVSCGTVSNVLNKKGNVSTEKIRLVEEAIQKLGYSANQFAQTLRAKKKKSIFLMIPDMRSHHYINFYNSILKQMSPLGYTVSIHATQNLLRSEKELLQEAISAKVDSIITFPTYIQPEIYDSVPESIFLVFIGPSPSNVTRPFVNASFNYRQIAENITTYITHKNYKNVLLFVDSVRFSHEFVSDILKNLRRKNISVTTYGSTTHNAVVRAFSFCDPGIKIDAVITSNSLRANAVHLAYTHTLTTQKIPEIITLSSKSSLFDTHFTSVYLDYTALGNLLSERLIARDKGKNPSYSPIILSSEQLSKKNSSIAHYSRPDTLKIFAPAGYYVHTMRKLLPQFEQLSGLKTDLKIYQRTDASFLRNDILQQRSDILIMNQNDMKIASRSPYLSKDEDSDLWAALHAAIYANDTYYPVVSKKHCCFSFNSSVQMLFYRADLLKDHNNRRDFYEHYYRELCIPENLEMYNSIVKHFSRASNPFSDILYGTSMSSLHSEYSFEEIFFHISAQRTSLRNASGHYFFNTPDVIHALRHYLRHLSLSNASHPRHNVSAIDEYLQGNTLMSIFSTGNAPVFNEDSNYAITDCTKSCDIPTDTPIIDCNIIGITKHCQCKEQALQFLKWIFQDAITDILTLVSGQPIKHTAVKNTEILSLYPWLQYFDPTFQKGIFLSDAFPACLFATPLRDTFISVLTSAYYNPGTLENEMNEFQKSYEQMEHEYRKQTFIRMEDE